MSRSLSHQVGILTLGRIFAYAVMFFVPIVNTRALTVEHYGYYRQFWLLFETLSPLLILGFPRSLMYYLPRAENERDKAVYVTQTLTFLIIMSAVAIGIYALMGNFLGEGMGALVRAFFLRLSAFTLFMMVSEYMEWLFVAEKRVQAQSIYHFTVASMQAVIVIVLSWMTRDVDSIVWGLAIFAAAKFLFAMGYTFTIYRPSLRLVSFSTIREQFSFALPIGLAGIALIMLGQTDKFIINRFLGREAFAMYAIGAFQVPFVNIIRGSITNVTFPLMAEYQKVGDHEAILALWRKALLKTVVLFFPLFVFLEVSARQFITILFTETYAEAIPIFAIYLLLFLRSSVETGNIIQVFKKTNFIFKVFAVGFFVNLAISLGLFFWIGRLGVPIGTVITMYLVNGFNLYYSSRLLKVPFLRLFPVLSMMQRFTIAAIPGIGLWYLYGLYHVDNIFELGIAGVVYFGVYFGLCFGIGYITLDDLKSLLGRKSS